MGESTLVARVAAGLGSGSVVWSLDGPPRSGGFWRFRSKPAGNRPLAACWSRWRYTHAVSGAGRRRGAQHRSAAPAGCRCDEEWRLRAAMLPIWPKRTVKQPPGGRQDHTNKKKRARNCSVRFRQSKKSLGLEASLASTQSLDLEVGTPKCLVVWQ